MKSILDALVQANAQIAGLRDTLMKAREALARQAATYPDLKGWLDPQIADLDVKIAALETPLSPEKLAALAGAILAELKDIGTLHFTPTPHAGDGI